MYLEYFGLKTEPFNLTPDPEFLYLGEGHKEALARLQFGIETQKGLMVLTGEVGSGKTTLIQSLISNNSQQLNFALIVNPKIVGNRLLQNVCREFGIDLDFKEMSKSDIFNLLYEYILKKSFHGEDFTVIIDDAHDLVGEQMDDILFLSKFETNTKKLLQIILVGLPELLDLLNSPSNLSLKQRIQIQYKLKPFSYADTQNYILHRMSVAGAVKRNIFKAEAIQRIFQLSRGIPRTISVIASNSLLYAFLKGEKRINYDMVNLATDETLQSMIDAGAENQELQIGDKYPPRTKAKNYKAVRRRGWSFWLFLIIILAMGILGLNILAQYLIKTLHIF